jgi:hypothetical protein
VNVFNGAAPRSLSECQIENRGAFADDLLSYFRKMLQCFSSHPFYTKYVCLPRRSDPVTPEIAQNPKRSPFFDNAIGAIDGTHISCAPSAADKDGSRNRKGALTQNCLMACSFDLKFVYVCSGWEGSAADALVYHDARCVDFRIPPGKFYLADTGFGLSEELLVPYRGVRYHLAEWKRAANRYVTHSWR